MGMHTEMCLAVELKADTPREIVDALHYMAGNTDAEPETLPDHEFFKCSRWRQLPSGDICYFAADSSFIFRYDYISGYYRLTFRANFKNYDREQEKFLKLIEPWLETENEFVGHQRYEEADHPTLIYVNHGGGFVMRDLNRWEG